MKKALFIFVALMIASVAHAHPQHHEHLEQIKKAFVTTPQWDACYLDYWHNRVAGTEVAIQALTLEVGAVRELYAKVKKTYVVPAVHEPIFNYLHTIPIDPPGEPEHINDVYFCNEHRKAELATRAWAQQALLDVKKDKAKFYSTYRVTIEKKKK